MAAPTADAVADAMYALLKDYAGKKNLKAMDLTKSMHEKFGDECDKQTCKDAIRDPHGQRQDDVLVRRRQLRRPEPRVQGRLARRSAEWASSRRRRT